jgi:RNA polymerase sigma factor (sigma-70 family)
MVKRPIPLRQYQDRLAAKGASRVILGRRDGALNRELQTLYNLGAIRDLTDGQLLERFATDADEVAELAFSALVERHEAMVWRVCLAIVRDEHDAEDAFQATFLILVRKARSLWVRQSLGPWLHQVAYRTASCLRRTVIRRRQHERRSAATNASRFIEVGTPRDPDRDAAIHEEVNRLPEKYRAPVVLCDLEGRTHQEAARFIGWPIGTVKSRQAQGRQLIRDRLVRRGFGTAVAGFVVESLRQTALTAMPEEVSRSTVNAAIQQSARFLTGFGVSARVLELTQGVLRAMLWIRLRSVTVVTIAVGIASGEASVYVCGSQGPAPRDAQPVSKQPTTTTEHSPTPEPSRKATRLPATAEPRARLRAQQLATRMAKASYEIAKLTRELAELAVEEYQEVIYPRDLATVGAEIKRAESDLARSDDRLQWAKRMFEKKQISQDQRISEELNRKKAKFALEQALSKRSVLVDYTKGKTIKELQSAVEKARSDERAKQAACEVEQINELELGAQLRLKKK